MKVIKKERDSNIELLRLLAMFLVLVVHADFFSLGIPTQAEVVSSPINAFTRFFFESLSIVCVNVFVLISGWFGIHPSKKGFCNFAFQCLFFLFGIYVVLVLCRVTPLSAKGLAGCLVLLPWNWFIKAYVGLYILAPVLNAYVKSADRATQKLVLICFFLFQSIYSWLNGAAVFFENGYSTLSFVGLYLLARYINVFKPRWAFTPPIRHFTMYVVLTLVLTVISIVATRFGVERIAGRIYLYVNPLVIASALSLLLCFKGISVKSKSINWLAASSFAIFLLHTNPNLCEPYFIPCVSRIYSSYNGVMCLICILVFLVAVAFLAILIDQIRKLIWNHGISKYL